MEIEKATAIFKNIDQVAASDAEKIEAINEVVAMQTHNGITKIETMRALNWAMKYCCFLELKAHADTERLEHRLKHLLQSNFIRSFDEVNTKTQEYKRDIKEADGKILYLCDGKKCENGYIECQHTTDITHAKNFEYDGGGRYWEKSESVRNCPKVSEPEPPKPWILKNGLFVCPYCKEYTDTHFNFCPWCGKKVI